MNTMKSIEKNTLNETEAELLVHTSIKKVEAIPYVDFLELSEEERKQRVSELFNQWILNN